MSTQTDEDHAPPSRTPLGRALGDKKLAALGLDVRPVREPRLAFARACVDLTQRRPHLGGALGAALLRLCVARGWILRTRHSRVVSVTPKGNEAFGKLFV